MTVLRPASGTVNRLFRIFARMRQEITISLAFVLILAGCSGEIYLRDGVTDGDTFYLAERAMADDDPVYQSWVRYSLAKSACQLQIDGNNPARANSFGCELDAHRLLVAAWAEKRSLNPAISDPYLNNLQLVQEAGFLDEYVVHHFSADHWEVPEDLDSRAYRRWSRKALRRHKAQVRITGSWNYAKNVRLD
jgi:hypothetical protein